MKALILAAILAISALAPTAAHAHDPVTARVCADDYVDGASNDCVQVDTDTEAEDGVYLTVDGDDSDPRGDGTTDGYVTVHVGRGSVAVYCEDDGGFNHQAHADDDDNGTNEECSA